MIVLLPMRLGGPGEVAIALSDKTVEAVVQDLGRAEPEYVNLSMPSFKTEFGADLIPAFSSLGMTLAFNQDRADFTGITESTKEEDRIHISQIQHKTVIDVTEVGTVKPRIAPPQEDWLGNGAAKLARDEAGGERIEQEQRAKDGRLDHPSLARCHAAKDRLRGLFGRKDRREDRI